MATIEITASRLIEPYLDKLRPYKVTVPDDLMPPTQIGARVQVFNDGDADGWATLALRIAILKEEVTTLKRIPAGGSATLVVQMAIPASYAGMSDLVVDALLHQAYENGKKTGPSPLLYESATLDVGQTEAERKRSADLRYQQSLAQAAIFDVMEQQEITGEDVFGSEAHKKAIKDGMREQLVRQRQDREDRQLQQQAKRDREKAERDRDQQQKDYQRFLLQQQQEARQDRDRERNRLHAQTLAHQRKLLADEAKLVEEHTRNLWDEEQRIQREIKAKTLIEQTREVLSRGPTDRSGVPISVWAKDPTPPTIYIGSQEWLEAEEDWSFEDEIDDRYFNADDMRYIRRGGF